MRSPLWSTLVDSLLNMERQTKMSIKLQLFPLSLIAMAFAWYSSLPPNSIQNWADMEWLFHDRFYWLKPEVTMADLMTLEQ